MTQLPIDDLHAHPSNSNVMPRKLLDKLVNQIKCSGRYPAVIVRPIDHGYQILDGHHRVIALRELEHQAVNCEVWGIDDREALMFLASLNRLQGEDDPRKRAALVSQLRETIDLPELAQLLPEDAGRLKKLAQLNEPLPALEAPLPLDQMPVAVHFFLLPRQRRSLERELREIGGERGSALMEIVARRRGGDG